MEIWSKEGRDCGAVVSNGTFLLKEEAKGRVSVHTGIVYCVEETVVRVWQAVPNPPMIDRCNNEGRKKLSQYEIGRAHV